MTIKDIYNAYDKTSASWNIKVYYNGGSADNILASCGSYHDVDGSTNVNDGFLNYPYSVKELFDHEVLSFHCVTHSEIAVEIAPWDGMNR